MTKVDNLLEQASLVQKQYNEGLQYKKQMGFLTKWAENERFKAGDQWAPKTDKTKNLPRPTLNVIAQIENHKISSVMNENIKMVFSANDVEEGTDEYKAADLFTRYADSTWENVKQDSLNEEALESAANVGTGIWHYYFDNSVYGGNVLKYKGDLRGESLDPVNFFPSDPQNRNVQDQQYVIISYRDMVENVKREAKQNGISDEIISLIKSDNDTQDQTYDMAKNELSGSNKVTVITKYWKVFQIPATHPTVHFLKVASGVVFKPDTDMKIKLYPLAVMQWERRKRSIFGISNTEQLIDNQKSINFLYAMQILSAQLTGFPKTVVDRGIISQPITNAPGEVINVNGNPGEIKDAIQYLNPPQMSASIPNLVQMFTSATKDTAGANENSLGEQTSSNMPASAIMMLQKAAGIPLESIKRRFYQAMEDVGNIWAEFWRVYYNTDRKVRLKNDNSESYIDTFNGSLHKDVDMNLKIDIGASSSYSESLMMASLDKLFDKQVITPEQYLQYAPRNVVPFKDSLLKALQQQQQTQQPNIEQLISQLTPDEQQAFLSAPPEQQQAILAQMQQHMSQQMPNMNQSAPM